MSNCDHRKKNKSKHVLWEAMTTEELLNMLGKKGRAKSIRSILRKRIQAANILLPEDKKIPLGPINKGLQLY